MGNHLKEWFLITTDLLPLLIGWEKRRRYRIIALKAPGWQAMVPFSSSFPSKASQGFRQAPVGRWLTQAKEAAHHAPPDLLTKECCQWREEVLMHFLSIASERESPILGVRRYTSIFQKGGSRMLCSWKIPSSSC